MSRHPAHVVFCTCAALLAGLSGAARAQARLDAPDAARFRFGSLGLTPDVRITDVGLDSNVFNEAEAPREDFTYTVSPRLRGRLDLPAADLTLSSRLDLVHFQEYVEQRAANTDSSVGVEIPLNRLTLRGAASYLDARERPNSEIDVRSRRTATVAVVGADWRMSGVTVLGFEARRARIAFEADELFDGEYLPDRLNREEENLAASFRYAVTPLTTLVVDGDLRRTRFTRDPLRDSDSVRGLVGVELHPSALLSGHALVGYRVFDGRHDALPDFDGVVASGDITYAIGRTRLSVGVDRDVTYSYRREAPYYVRTGWAAALRQRVGTSWELEARSGQESLDYSAAGPVGLASPRETVRRWGAGVAYDVGRFAQVRIDAEYRRRVSFFHYRTYEALRTGLSLILGF